MDWVVKIIKLDPLYWTFVIYICDSFVSLLKLIVEKFYAEDC